MLAKLPSSWCRAFTAASLGLAVALGCGPAEPAPRNVLLVSIDTLRADHVGAYGAAEAATPGLDALAAGGVRFETAIAPTPLTLPSHTTLLTGLDPPHHGVRHNGIHRVPQEIDTLAERLSAAGFATGAAIGSTVLAGRSGLRQGFDFYDDRIGGEFERAQVQRRAADVNEAALGWLAEAPEPFFLFVHYYDPHASYDPPAPFAEAFAGRPYDGEIAYTDASLARLLDALHERGSLERTLVVVTADHGESLGEHQELTHSYGVYDATQRVPLVIQGPGVPAGRVVGGIARTADVAPTILARFGLPAGPVDGRDLEELWIGDAPAERHAYVESLATRLDHGWSPLHGLRTADWLYVRAPRRELYDVARDPGQLDDLLDSAPGAHRETAEALEQALGERLRAERAAETAALDEATLAQLHALGYAVSPEPVAETGADPKDALAEQRLYQESERLLAEGRPERAAELLESLLERHPASALGHGRLASVLLEVGRIEDALAHARRATELRPEAAPLWIQLGDVQGRLSEVEAAEAAYRRAVALDPESPAARVRLVELLISDERTSEARPHAERAAELAPRDAPLLRRLADTWERTGDATTALAWYQRVLAVAPESERDHMHAAVHLARLGRFEESDRHLARAGEVRAQPRARRALAEAYRASARSRDWAGEGGSAPPAAPAEH